jgi:NAD-dependent dihydropyrimidine dehydrogenase PreA subunit
MVNKENKMADKDKLFAVPNVVTPSRPVIFTDKCQGCNACVEVCPVDVYMPHPEKGKSPIILHPDECWYCGSCVDACKIKGAIEFNWPLQQRGYWKNKTTGKITRVKSK